MPVRKRGDRWQVRVTVARGERIERTLPAGASRADARMRCSPTPTLAQERRSPPGRRQVPPERRSRVLRPPGEREAPQRPTDSRNSRATRLHIATL